MTVDIIWLTNGTIGTTNGTIGTNVSTNDIIGTNGNIGCRKTFRALWLPMVPLATNGTIGIFQWYHWENPERTPYLCGQEQTTNKRVV